MSRRGSRARPSAGAPAPKRRRRLVLPAVLLAALVLAVAGGLGVRAWLGPRAPGGIDDWTPPAIDVGEMEPPVAAAIGAALESVRRRPDSAEAWGRLGGTCDVHQVLDAAVHAYERARALDVADMRWPYLLAMVEQRRGAPSDRVIALFQAALTLAPDYAAAQYSLGEMLLREGRHDDADAAFRRALAIDGDLAVAHRALGQSCLGRGRLEEARAHLERAAALGPGDRGTNVALAQVLERLGLDDEAAAAAAHTRDPGAGLALPDPVRHAVEELGTSAEHCRARARALMDAGRPGDAIAPLRTAASVRSADPEIEYRLGRALLETGARAEGRRHLERALSLREDLPAAHALLGALLFDGGEIEAAIAHLERAVALAPDNDRYLAALQQARRRSGR